MTSSPSRIMCPSNCVSLLLEEYPIFPAKFRLLDITILRTISRLTSLWRNHSGNRNSTIPADPQPLSISGLDGCSNCGTNKPLALYPPVGSLSSNFTIKQQFWVHVCASRIRPPNLGNRTHQKAHLGSFIVVGNLKTAGSQVFCKMTIRWGIVLKV